MSTKSLEEYDTCPICANNRRKITWVTCSKCSFSSCRGCVKRFLLELPDINPVCMSCKAQWDFEFLANNTDEKFHNHTYRDYRAKIIVDRERSLLPATQPYVATMKKKEDIKAEIEEVSKEIRMYQELLYEANRKKSALRTKVRELEAESGDVKEENAGIRFIGHCPHSECKGFLDTEYVCGLCKEKACRSCRLPKHKGDCDKDVVETVRMLAKDTKGCPNCGVPIFRISGCDQMFCQDENTPIWMWSGEKKLAKDIIVGDILIGDDGLPRKVEALTSGSAEMYEISTRFGDNYRAIGKHLLSLSKKGHIVDISVEDFLKIKRRRDYHALYSGVIHWPEQPVPIDPYILGLWLGNGTSRGDGFSSNDTEIVKAWVNWGTANDTEFVHSSPFYYTSRGKGQGTITPVGYNSMATCRGCQKKQSLCCASLEELDELLFKDPQNKELLDLVEWRKNIPKYEMKTKLGKQRSTCFLKQTLRNLGLIDIKHIPLIYMLNSEKIRMQVLAGIIDTDGNNGKTGYRFSQSVKREKLCRDIQDLSRSLGFRTTWKTQSPGRKLFSTHGKEYDCSNQIYVRIIGDIGRIPVKLPHKKINRNTAVKCTIKVRSVGTGKYAGWSVSGGSPRYLLGDGTVTHNCTKCHTPFDWRTGKIETGRIHNPHYYEFQRQNGGERREPGEVRCGGQVDYYGLHRRITENGLEENILNWVMSAHILSGHIRGILLPQYRDDQVGERTNRDLRIKYLLGLMTDKDWISEIKRREKRREKNRAICLAMTMFADTMDDLQANILVGDAEDIPTFLVQMKKLRQYTKTVLENIGVRFQNKVPIITKDWRIKDIGIRNRRAGMEN